MNRRTLIACLLPLGCPLPPAYASTPQAEAPRSVADRVSAVGAIGAHASLNDLLTAIHERAGVPAIAAAYVRGDEVLDMAATGLHSVGSDTTFDTRDPVHLGSVTKSFTALVIGRLVERGELDWKTTVAAVLGSDGIRPEYHPVTVEQLLRHRGGLSSYTTSRPDDHPRTTYEGRAREKRRAFVRDVLGTQPAVPPGTATLYSNASYTVVGHMAECVTDLAWEDLVRDLVLEPLRMQHAGTGIPDVPRGHVERDGAFASLPREAYSDLELVAPAGNLHASLEDMVHYAQAHLTGLAGRDGVLRATTMQRLHAPGDDDDSMVCGWQRQHVASRRVHKHAGSAGGSYAEVSLYPDDDAAVVVLMTVPGHLGAPLATRVDRAFRHRYLVPTSDFTTKSRPQSIEQGIATDEDDDRLWQVVGQLAHAFNDEDRDAYHALFANDDRRAGRDSMFDFMAQDVLPSRGAITAFHALSDPLRVGGAKRAIRLAVFHLENGTPGYFGVALDEESRILELSLFVKNDLCKHGIDPACPLTVRHLDRDFGGRR